MSIPGDPFMAQPQLDPKRRFQDVGDRMFGAAFKVTAASATIAPELDVEDADVTARKPMALALNFELSDYPKAASDALRPVLVVDAVTADGLWLGTQHTRIPGLDDQQVMAPGILGHELAYRLTKGEFRPDEQVKVRFVMYGPYKHGRLGPPIEQTFKTVTVEPPVAT
jgi:hypothetical protein